MCIRDRKQVFEYLELLDGGKYTHAQLEEIIRVLQQTLCCRKLDIKDLEDADLVTVSYTHLDVYKRQLLFGPFLYESASGPFFERVLAQNLSLIHI